MQLVTLKNDKIEVQLLTYAAIIHRIIVPDRKGSPPTWCWATPPPGITS